MLNQESSNNNSSTVVDNTFCPILWVSPDEYIDAISHECYLSNIFEIRNYKEIADYTVIDNSQQQYIFDTGATEEIIKAIAWKVGECSIYTCESKLPLSYIAPDYITGAETFDCIFNRSVNIQSWLKEVNSEANKLDTDNALTLAQLAIKLLKGKAKSVELAILRKRCNESSFDWNRHMKELEREFREELERRNITDKKLSRLERLKLELLAVSEETDYCKRDDLLEDISIRYSKKVFKLERMLDELNISTSKPKARRLSAAELHATKNDDVQWIIPGLLPAIGVTMVGANPGVGKTTLAYDCAASIIYNQKFLDEQPLKTGKVIFVNSFGEMNDNEILSSFVDRSIGISEKYEMLLDWDMTQLPELEKMIDEVQPALIVIDSFRGITNYLSNFDENNSKAGLPIQRLQGLCNRYKTAILLIHHNSKRTDYNAISKSGGNFSIAASCSAVWQLDKNDMNKNIVLSTAKIRGAEPRQLTLTLDGFNRRFNVLSDSDKSNEQENKTIPEKVIQLLASTPNQAMQLKEIHNLINESYDSTQKAVKRLSKKNQVSVFLGGENNNTKMVQIIFTPPLPDYMSETVVSTPQNIDTQASEVSGQVPDSTDNLPDNIPDNSIKNESVGECPESERIDIEAIEATGQLLDNNLGGGLNNECPKESTDNEIQRGTKCKYVGDDSVYKNTEIIMLTYFPEKCHVEIYFLDQRRSTSTLMHTADLEPIEHIE